MDGLSSLDSVEWAFTKRFILVDRNRVLHTDSASADRVELTEAITPCFGHELPNTATEKAVLSSFCRARPSSTLPWASCEYASLLAAPRACGACVRPFTGPVPAGNRFRGQATEAQGPRCPGKDLDSFLQSCTQVALAVGSIDQSFSLSSFGLFQAKEDRQRLLHEILHGRWHTLPGVYQTLTIHSNYFALYGHPIGSASSSTPNTSNISSPILISPTSHPFSRASAPGSPKTCSQTSRASIGCTKRMTFSTLTVSSPPSSPRFAFLAHPSLPCHCCRALLFGVRS